MKRIVLKGIFLVAAIGVTCSQAYKKRRNREEKSEEPFERVILPKKEITRELYFKNPKTMRYHCASCNLVTPEKISNKRLIITNFTPDELEKEGYLPCSRCMPKKASDVSGGKENEKYE